MSARKWLNCRLTDLGKRLEKAGHKVSLPVISRLLKKHQYSLKAARKQVEDHQHPNRNQQFEHIQEQRQAHQAQGQPTNSVDTKKKKLVGNFKNPGQIWCQTPERVKMHGFPSQALGRATPYRIYDPQHQCGSVYVGQSADTTDFAVDNIAYWCRTEMPERFSNATHLLIEADYGGSNGYHSRVWKQDLQTKTADTLGLTVTVCHYPTGTSKWNPIEHRLFSEISKTWAGCPLRSFETLVNYIRQTTTQTGLTVQARLVTETYAKSVKVPDEEMEALNLQPHHVCPQRNYTISPRAHLPPL